MNYETFETVNPEHFQIAESALKLLEIVCKSSEDCNECPMKPGRTEVPDADAMTPNEPEVTRCAYHLLAIAVNKGRAWKMCPACQHFWKGGCDLHVESRGYEPCVDLNEACERYEQADRLRGWCDYDA